MLLRIYSETSREILFRNSSRTSSQKFFRGSFRKFSKGSFRNCLENFCKDSSKHSSEIFSWILGNNPNFLKRLLKKFLRGILNKFQKFEMFFKKILHGRHQIFLHDICSEIYPRITLIKKKCWSFFWDSCSNF